MMTTREIQDVERRYEAAVELYQNATAGGDPEQAREAFALLETLGRTAVPTLLAEVRRLQQPRRPEERRAAEPRFELAS